ncbi:MAG: SAM-dependent chlorinase/fluorinase [Anaerolineaceae bacterium]|nr:SAM-dependent chlorinase/fluorinase [Anaerolineaceae bacterium]
MAIITLLTDFGLKDGFVGIMKGVIWGIAPTAQIADITHDIAPQNVIEGSLVLAQAVKYFPDGTVHVAVVDPGVGTTRKPVAARIGSQYFVGPDNGLFTGVIEAAEADGISIEFYHLTNPKYWLPQVSRSFHGRDIFSPVGAHLCNGVALAELGTPIADPARIMVPRPEPTADGFAGQVLSVDHFGNLLTNITPEQLNGTRGVVIKVGEASIDGLSLTFGERKPGELVAMIDSSGVLQIAVVNGNAADKLKVGIGTTILLRFC